jgi:hypothetical protein
MNKIEAVKKLRDLVKKGAHWVDQGHGHGHYEFNLPHDEFQELVDASRNIDLLEAVEVEEIRKKCIEAVEAVTEPKGPMPQANIDIHHKYPELGVRSTIRSVKKEAIENIKKVKV